jgi:hypothetical protein
MSEFVASAQWWRATCTQSWDGATMAGAWSPQRHGVEAVVIVYIFRNRVQKMLRLLAAPNSLCFHCVRVCFRHPAIIVSISDEGRRRSGDYKWYQSEVPSVDARPCDRCCFHGQTAESFLLAATASQRGRCGRCERFGRRRAGSGDPPDRA